VIHPSERAIERFRVKFVIPSLTTGAGVKGF